MSGPRDIERRLREVEDLAASIAAALSGRERPSVEEAGIAWAAAGEIGEIARTLLFDLYAEERAARDAGALIPGQTRIEVPR